MKPLPTPRRHGSLSATVTLALALLAPGVARGQPQNIPDADCLVCHEDQELTKTDSEGRETSLFVDAELLRASVHSTQSCVDCHPDVTAEHPDDERAIQPVHCATCHAEQSASYGESVHGRANEYGTPGAATCVDCHGRHQILPSTSPESPMHRSQLLEACAACHEAEAADVRESVHGQALLAGVREAPSCTDCHSEHAILNLREVSRIGVAQDVCSRCHASERLNVKYRLPRDRVRTFLGSYHGLAAKLGSTRAANCASCHGVHRILPSTDARSSVHPDNLVQTCGQCHPGATANFALGKVHLDLESDSDDLGATVNRWVRRLYLGLILVTAGTCLFHNGLIWLRQALAARYAQQHAPLRMEREYRWQHGILALSFVLLALSGFALKFPDSWIAWTLGSDEDIRRWTHRGAAVVMLLLGLYHVVHIWLTNRGRQLLRDLLPTRQDPLDALANLQFGLGRRSRLNHPNGRFGYAEKIEYWAVVWGIIVMGVTGMIIWFPVSATQFMPRWIVDVATTIHYYEAILACLAIVLWHIYHVVFDPEVYPLNWAFWDGHGPAAGPRSQKNDSAD
jgi:formate dehydrogenase gamma subunit